MRLTIDLKKKTYHAKFETTVETEFHENNNTSVSNPNLRQHKWKIFSKIIAHRRLLSVKCEKERIIMETQKSEFPINFVVFT